MTGCPHAPTAAARTTGAPVADLRGLALLRAVRRDRLGVLTAAHRAHGPVVRLRGPGRAPLYLVSDPDEIRAALVGTHRGYAKGVARRGDPAQGAIEPLRRALGDGLLTSAPPLHQRQRRLIQPLLTAGRVAEHADTIVALTESHLRGWRDGQTRDLHADLADLTLTILTRTVFDVVLDSPAGTAIRDAVGTDQPTLRRAVLPWGRLLDRLPTPATRRLRRSREALDAVLADLIGRRRSGGSGGTDLLSVLLAARTDDGAPMDDALVRDEALTLLLAGHETTANALSWSLHLLAEHPDARATLQRELDDAVGDRPLGGDDLARLPYTRAVLRETLRLYPPAWLIVRHLTVERDVGGHRLPAGATLLLSPWVVHRDPRWWPEPDQFRPERWLTHDPDRPVHAYFPFGSGPRRCVGQRFAELEAELVLGTLVRRWDFRSAPDAPTVRAQALITLRPRCGPQLTVRRRGLCDGEGAPRRGEC